jgi:hypothetical protein
VLEFATIDGARACALDHKIGTITPGKQADIILIRTDQVNVAPVVDPVATVVISADTSNVDTVFVAGRILKHNGQLSRIDLPRLLQRLNGARDHLLSNAGVIPKWILSRRTANCSDSAAKLDSLRLPDADVQAEAHRVRGRPVALEAAGLEPRAAIRPATRALTGPCLDWPSRGGTIRDHVKRVRECLAKIPCIRLSSQPARRGTALEGVRRVAGG